MARLTRFLAGAVALGGIAIAAGAQADQNSAVVDSKRLAESVVVLSGTTYRVGEGTAISDKDGNSISLAELPTLAQGASADDAAVWYEASDSQVATPVLHVLKLTGAQPK
jgi:hypothetical protein